MPELPEVETVCRGLAPLLEGQRLIDVQIRRRDLRWPIAADFEQRLHGKRVDRVSRRAKYGLLWLESGDLVLLHLGMSGRIRLDPLEDWPHDHIQLTTQSHHRIVYHDPRRFGSWHVLHQSEQATHPLLAALGPEPLDDSFTGATLTQAFQARKTPLKAALLDQKNVAGLGNIYVCEALFLARLSPTRPAGSLTATQNAHLVHHIKAVLTQAIAAGGSSLRDYVQVDGELGYFQHAWQVYGREGAPCPACAQPIQRTVNAGRSTFFCATCQV